MSFDWEGEEMRENCRVSGTEKERSLVWKKKRPQQKAGTKLVGQKMHRVKHTGMWKTVRGRSLEKWREI